MNITDIMTKDILVGYVNETITEVASKMRTHDIGFLPIIKDNKVTGVITDRDIITRAISNDEVSNQVIESYITKNIVTISSTSTILDALKLISKYKVKRLIVTEQRRMIGILSISDFISNSKFDALILNTLRQLWEIHRTTDFYTTEIDEFYL